MNKALLVGINAYPGNELEGCVNDVMDMRDFLKSKCGYQASDIKVLTDDAATTAEIQKGLDWLTADVGPGDRILFHYSGHGAQMPSHNLRQEVDGLDEVICPVDFDWSDQYAIRDKQFNQRFKAVPKGVEFVWVSDSCHSGDLEKELGRRPKQLYPPPAVAAEIQQAEGKGLQPRRFVHTVKGLNLALVSGCKSRQTSSDASFNGRPNGALTYFLLQSLQSGLSASLDHVVTDVRTALKSASYTQQPQLEGSLQIIGAPFLAATVRSTA